MPDLLDRIAAERAARAARQGSAPPPGQSDRMAEIARRRAELEAEMARDRAAWEAERANDWRLGGAGAPAGASALPAPPETPSPMTSAPAAPQADGGRSYMGDVVANFGPDAARIAEGAWQGIQSAADDPLAALRGIGETALGTMQTATIDPRRQVAPEYDFRSAGAAEHYAQYDMHRIGDTFRERPAQTLLDALGIFGLAGGGAAVAPAARGLARGALATINPPRIPIPDAPPRKAAPLRSEPSEKTAGIIREVRPSPDDPGAVLDAQTSFGYIPDDAHGWVSVGDLKGGVSVARGEADRVAALADQIRQNGYMARIVIDDAGNVIEGQHRLEAARRLGLDEIPVTRIVDRSNTYPMAEIMDAFPMRQDLARQAANNVAAMLDEAGSADAAMRKFGDRIPEQRRADYARALRIGERGRTPEGARVATDAGDAVREKVAGVKGAATEATKRERGIRDFIANAPTTEALHRQADAFFEAARRSGVRFTVAEFGPFRRRIVRTLRGEGADRVLHPKIARLIGIIENAPPGVAPDMGNMMILRRQFGAAASDIDKSTSRLGAIGIDLIDDFVESGSASASGIMRDANRLWSQMRKAETIERAIAKAQTAQRGVEAGLRQEFKSVYRGIIDKNKKYRGFTPDEVKAIKAVAEGNFTANVLRRIAGLSGGAGAQRTMQNLIQGSAVGGGIGFALGGPVGGALGALAGPAAGQVAGRMALRGTERRADLARAMAARGETPKQARKGPQDSTLAELLSGYMETRQ